MGPLLRWRPHGRLKDPGRRPGVVRQTKGTIHDGRNTFLLHGTAGSVGHGNDGSSVWRRKEEEDCRHEEESHGDGLARATGNAVSAVASTVGTHLFAAIRVAAAFAEQGLRFIHAGRVVGRVMRQECSERNSTRRGSFSVGNANGRPQRILRPTSSCQPVRAKNPRWRNRLRPSSTETSRPGCPIHVNIGRACICTRRGGQTFYECVPSQTEKTSSQSTTVFETCNDTTH